MLCIIENSYDCIELVNVLYIFIGETTVPNAKSLLWTIITRIQNADGVLVQETKITTEATTAAEAKSQAWSQIAATLPIDQTGWIIQVEAYPASSNTSTILH